MWTITGRSLDGSAGRHTLMNRQSSLVGPVLDGDRHESPNDVASNVVDHGVGGCGGCQRRAPTGGAAYGIPQPLVDTSDRYPTH